MCLREDHSLSYLNTRLITTCLWAYANECNEECILFSYLCNKCLVSDDSIPGTALRRQHRPRLSLVWEDSTCSRAAKPVCHKH